MTKLERLQQLATAVAGVAGVAVPLVGNVVSLAGAMKAIAADLETVPLDDNGQPLTLEAAHAKLDLKVTASNAQDLQMQADAAARIKENHPDK